MQPRDDYRNQCTLIAGDVNTGKTRATAAILKHWIAINPTPLITVLDLAPEPVRGIGGRLILPATFAGRYLFADIVPPRLTGRNPEEIAQLAAANARTAERLFDAVLKDPHPTLVINDASLYLQAGDYDRLAALMASAGTVLINAYYGRRFQAHPISDRERRLTEQLIQDCDQVIRLPGNARQAES
jgi:hypothetical protein